MSVCEPRPCPWSSRGGEFAGLCGAGEAEEVFPSGCRMVDGKQLGSGALSVDPGDRHPLWRAAGLLKGFLQQLEALFHVVVDQGQVEVVCIAAPDALRVLAELLQSLRLQGTAQCSAEELHSTAQLGNTLPTPTQLQWFGSIKSTENP